MPLINTAVPNLIQGVSQQSEAARFSGQCEEQVNALSSVADGLKKRPNTRHIAKLLTSAITSNSFVHFINRSGSEKYVLIHSGLHLYAYSMTTGVEQDIKVGAACYKASWTAAELAANNNYVGTGYPVSNTYLQTTNARTFFKGLTIADTTFLLNTESSVALGTTFSPAVAKEALLFVKQGDYQKKYGFSVNLLGTASAAQPSNSSNNSSNVAYSPSNNASNSQAAIAFITADTQLTGSKRASTRAYISIITIPQGGTGLGFSVNDVVDLPLPAAQSVRTEDEEGDDFNYYAELILYIQPTMRVNSVDSSGKILTASIENAGSFIYLEANNSYSYPFGLGNGTYQEEHGRGAGSAVLKVPSTNNHSSGTDGTDSDGDGVSDGQEISDNTDPNDATDFVDSTVSGTGNTGTITSSAYRKIFTSGSALDTSENPTGVSYHTSSSTILGGVSMLTTTAGQHVGTTSGLGNIFTVSGDTQSNLLVLTSKGPDFDIKAVDDLSGGGMGVVYKEVSSISDLPLIAKNNFEVKVSGDAELNQDDYYVRFETTSGAAIGQGSWVECVAPNLRLGYNNATLPMELISDGTSFTLRTMKIADRLAGDIDSNPLASFVTRTIDNMFFFKNRLGFLCGENVTLSESGLGVVDSTGQLNYNFGRTTVTTLLDSDPIDISVASSRVTNLKAAKGFQENLILFSETGQFVLKGGNILTPKTVSITPITNFSFDAQVDPLPLGSYLYFPFSRGAFTGMREYTVNSSTDNYDSNEITEHVPSYIPKNIFDMAGTTSEDIIALLSGDEKDTLYIYNYFWNNEQKVLSAWSKFTFTGEIRGIEFIESTLYAVIVNNGETNLVEMPLESGLKDAAGFVTHLDMRVAKTVTHGTSSIFLPYTPADNSVQVYTTDGLRLNCTNSGGTVTLIQAVNDVDNNGNDINTNVWVGIPYTMKYTFSEQIFKDKSGNGSSPSNAAKLLVRNGSIYFDNTAFFKVKVTPEFRDTYENLFTPDVVGSTSLGTLNLNSGFYRFPVFSKAQDTKISIENESALPSNFQSAEFESFMHSRSSRHA